MSQVERKPENNNVKNEQDFIICAGIAPDVVMKWTGHADYKAMRPYIDIVDSIKAESMTKFNNLL